MLGRYGDSDAFPETVAPLLSALLALSTSTSSGGGGEVRRLLRHSAQVVSSCLGQVDRKVSARAPLAWRGTQAAAVEAKNPLYAVNYAMRKDKHDDTAGGEGRAKVKQLQRQLKRETKAAQRELRRDAEFLDRAAWEDKSAAEGQRREERGKNFAFMEEQQATINEQVRKGGGLMKGGGSGVARPLARGTKRTRR
jgi:nucleolar protein 14